MGDNYIIYEILLAGKNVINRWKIENKFRKQTDVKPSDGEKPENAFTERSVSQLDSSASRILK